MTDRRWLLSDPSLQASYRNQKYGNKLPKTIIAEAHMATKLFKSVYQLLPKCTDMTADTPSLMTGLRPLIATLQLAIPTLTTTVCTYSLLHWPHHIHSGKHEASSGVSLYAHLSVCPALSF